MRVRIRWLGHACFRIESSQGTVLVTDPYDESVPYKAPQGSAHLVLTSHEHFDHNAVHRIQGKPRIVREAGQVTAEGIPIQGLPTAHDPEGGRQRGPNVIFRFEVDDVVLAHFGDLGHSLDQQQKNALEDVEVAFLPVGGHFTIGAQEAVQVAKGLPSLRVLIPMHYRTDVIPDWPIQPVEAFVKASPFKVKRVGASEVKLTKATLPSEPEAWVLEHA